MARYALVVGIPEYSHLPSPLSKTQGDAEAVASLLRFHGDFQEVTLLNPTRLTKDELFNQLQRLLIQQAVGSEVLIYYTGHGVLAEDCGLTRGFLAPSNCVYTKENVTNGIPFDGLNELIGKSQLSSLVMLLDCCHSGSLLKSMAKIFTAFNSEKNYALMAACRDFEEAAAMKKEPHSIFTGALLQGLAKENANDRGQINTSSLFGFIENRLRLKGQEPVNLSYGQSIKIVDYRTIQPEQPITDICPYVGLNAFDRNTAQWFFGRDGAFDRLTEKLKQSSFVFVVGVSGSGKSSLVRAKLIPKLIEDGYQVFDMKPRRNPLEKLKMALTSKLNAADIEIMEAIEELIDRGDLPAVVDELPQKPILLVIDQFEEVFTLCADKQEQAKFLKMLAQVAAKSTTDLVIVATMRADFMGECSDANLDKIINEQMVWLSPMNLEEFKEAIVQPALTQRYELGEGLLEGILSDIEAEPNCLPLLEFALQKLWDHRDQQHRKLTADAYYRILKKIRGALNLHAETLYQGQSEAKQKWIRRLLLQLVRTGQEVKDTRQPTERQTLLALGKNAQEKKEIEIVLRALEGETGRLLTAYDENGVAMVDMAHEALMDGWERFQGWRLEHRQVRLLAGRIKDDHKQWLQVPEPDKDSFLLAQGVVTLVEKVIMEIREYLNPAQEKYLEQSIHKYKPWLNPTNFPEMVDIPAGQFWMGSPTGKGDDDEKPYHLVTLQGFRMGKYPITQAQWRTVALAPEINRPLNPYPSRFRGDSLPVEQVSCYEAEEFCARLSDITGETYRLPSEAEWEYACRAGAMDYQEYCFGDEVDRLDDYAWYGNNSGIKPIDALAIWEEVDKNASLYDQRLNQNQNATHPIGEKLPNAFGLYDMHGNVWEWCADDWHRKYENAPEDGTAWNNNYYSQEQNFTKVLRGGSWDNLARHCRSAFRYLNDARSHGLNYGFRVACGSFLPRTP